MKAAVCGDVVYLYVSRTDRHNGFIQEQDHRLSDMAVMGKREDKDDRTHWCRSFCTDGSRSCVYVRALFRSFSIPGKPNIPEGGLKENQFAFIEDSGVTPSDWRLPTGIPGLRERPRCFR